MEEVSKEEKKQLTAVTYLRAGFTLQANAESAIVAQQHICERRAKELGAQVVQEYVDYGASGSTINRPALQALLDSLQKQACDLVIVPEHKTVALTPKSYMQIVWLLEQAGAQLHVGELPVLEQQDGTLSAYFGQIGLRQHGSMRRQQESQQ